MYSLYDYEGVPDGISGGGESGRSYQIYKGLMNGKGIQRGSTS